MLEFKQITETEGFELSKPVYDTVFSKNYPENDGEYLYIIGYDGNRTIATGRMKKASNTACEISAIGVIPTEQHAFVGDLIIKVLEDRAVSFACIETTLVPTEASVGFFEYEGYEKLPNGTMAKDLTKVCRHCASCGK